MMKKFIVLMAIVAMVGLAQAELFDNGDFEAGPWSGGGSGSGGGGTPWGWQPFPPIYQQDSGGSDGGDWMQLDQSAAPWTGTWNWAWSGVWSNKVAAVSGDVLTVSGMAKYIAGDNTLRAFVSYEDAGGSRVDYDGDGDVDNDDRYMPTWSTGTSWAAFSDTFTVPLLDGMNNPFASPIAQLDVTFSVETAPGAVGIDQVSLVPEPMTIGLLGLGALFLRRRKA